MNCNDSQLAAINHKDGPALVLAGPGSGKTTVITQRTLKLITGYGIDPADILVVTYTRAAAREMKERFLTLYKGGKGYVTFGTFHSVFFSVLRIAYGYTAENIITENEKFDVLKKLIALYNVETEDENELISGLLCEISEVKSEGTNIDNFYSNCVGETVFRNIFNDYNKLLLRKNKLDFDDMLLMCYELFKARPDILKGWQDRYKYILIDEFQDINRIQYEIVKMLGRPRNNVFAVGDDDQSIYGFRGARPDLMSCFERDYAGIKKIVLNVNYRSADDIIGAAMRLISHNKNRFVKDIKGNYGAGGKFSVREYEDLETENTAIVDEIKRYVAMGGDYKDIAVLYRTNMTPRALIWKLMEHNIPFTARDVVPNIYDHFIFRHIQAYISIALGSRNRKDLIEIINKPKRYISRDCLDTEQIDFNRLRALYDDKDWVVDRIDKLEEDINMIRDMNPYAAVNYIRRGIGYDDYIREYAEHKKINEEDLFDILIQIQEGARDFNHFDEWFEHIEKYNRKLKEEMKTDKPESDSVTFSTMHSSKGLEYSCVFIIDANEGITPHRKSVHETDIEEERRMFYVAMTRAKRELYITSTRERYNKKLPVSRFVKEITG